MRVRVFLKLKDTPLLSLAVTRNDSITKIKQKSVQFPSVKLSQAYILKHFKTQSIGTAKSLVTLFWGKKKILKSESKSVSNMFLFLV